MQTTEIGCRDQIDALHTSTAALQDIGMIIAVTASDAGVVTGNKQRDARETGQIVGAVVLGILFGANAVQYDVAQNIRATLLIDEPSRGRCAVRVAFERVITDNKELTRSEYVLTPEIYNQFFQRLHAGAIGNV